jgi:hypothetical protein
MTRAREADPAGCVEPLAVGDLVRPQGWWTAFSRKRSPQDVPTEEQEALEIGTIAAVFLLVG